MIHDYRSETEMAAYARKLLGTTMVRKDGARFVVTAVRSLDVADAFVRDLELDYAHIIDIDSWARDFDLMKTQGRTHAVRARVRTCMGENPLTRLRIYELCDNGDHILPAQQCDVPKKQCDVCEGYGEVYVNTTNDPQHAEALPCPRCGDEPSSQQAVETGVAA